MSVFKLIRMHQNGQNEDLTEEQKELLNRFMLGQQLPEYMEMEKIFGSGNRHGLASSSENFFNFKSQGTTEMNGQSIKTLQVITDIVKFTFAVLKQDISTGVVFKCEECLYKARDRVELYEHLYGRDNTSQELIKVINGVIDSAKHHSAFDYL